LQKLRNAEIDEKRLDDERRSPDHVEIAGCNETRRLARGYAQKAEHQSQSRREDERDQGQLDGHAKTHKEPRQKISDTHAGEYRVFRSFLQGRMKILKRRERI
jgi:hypothetical protein